MNTNIGILGTGMMGTTLGKRLTQAGYEVMFGSRTPEKATSLARTVGADVQGGSLADAAAFGDIVVLAVGFEHAAATLAAAGDLSGKVLLDITSAWDTAQRPVQLLVGHTTSAAEELARLVPAAHVVKSLNFLYAEVLEQPVFDGVRADAYYCGDDEASKARVAEMLRALTLEPRDAGPLSSARLLEPLGLLWMRLARFSGAGPHSAFKLLQREMPTTPSS